MSPPVHVSFCQLFLGSGTSAIGSISGRLFVATTPQRHLCSQSFLCGSCGGGKRRQRTVVEHCKASACGRARVEDGRKHRKSKTLCQHEEGEEEDEMQDASAPVELFTSFCCTKVSLESLWFCKLNWPNWLTFFVVSCRLTHKPCYVSFVPTILDRRVDWPASLRLRPALPVRCSRPVQLSVGPAWSVVCFVSNLGVQSFEQNCLAPSSIVRSSRHVWAHALLHSREGRIVNDDLMRSWRFLSF